MKTMMKLVAILAVAGMTASAWADPISIPITNNGFEDPVLGNGSSSDTVNGWVQKHSDSAEYIRNAEGTGIWNWPPSSMETVYPGIGWGEQILCLFSWAGTTAVGVSQALGINLAPDADYVLSVWAGRGFADGTQTYDWGGATLSLWAGDNMLQSLEIPNPTDGYNNLGIWVKNTLTYTSGSSVTPGQELKIKLDATITNGVNPPAYFDVFQATTTVIPEPASTLAFLFGAGLLALVRRMRCC